MPRGIILRKSDLREVDRAKRDVMEKLDDVVRIALGDGVWRRPSLGDKISADCHSCSSTYTRDNWDGSPMRCPNLSCRAIMLVGLRGELIGANDEPDELWNHEHYARVSEHCIRQSEKVEELEEKLFELIKACGGKNLNDYNYALSKKLDRSTLVVLTVEESGEDADVYVGKTREDAYKEFAEVNRNPEHRQMVIDQLMVSGTSPSSSEFPKCSFKLHVWTLDL